MAHRGIGKTSLAKVISNHSKSRFLNLSGVESNVAEIRKSVESAESLNRLHKSTTTLFVDEIHRLIRPNKMCYCLILKEGPLDLLELPLIILFLCQ